MAKKNRDIEILVKLASQGNFDEATKHLENLKKGQEGAAAGGAGAIGKLKGAWASWTSMAEVSSKSIQTAFKTALGPIGLIIVVVEAVIRVFGKLIGWVKDYQKAQDEANKTVNAAKDAFDTANRHKEKYADATGIEVLGKAIKTHQEDLKNLAKNYDDIKTKVEGAGQQWWNLLGITSETTRSYQEQLALLSKAKQETENQTRAKEAQLETEKALEKAAKARETAETAIAERVAQLAMDETDLKLRAVDKQMEAYEKAGANEVKIAELKALEVLKIENDLMTKEEELHAQLVSRVQQATMDDSEFKKMKLEEDLAVYASNKDNETLVDQLRAVETAKIDKQVSDKKEAELKKRESDERAAMAAGKDALNNLATFQNSKNKEMAAVGKAAAISGTMISTYEGAQNAFTSLSKIPIVGVPLGVAAAAAAIAAGMARVATISGVELEAGGVVEKETYARIGEKGRKEGVLPLEDPRAMRLVGEAIANAGGSGGGNVFYNTFILPGASALQDPSVVREILETLAEQMERGAPAASRLALTSARRASADAGRAA